MTKKRKKGVLEEILSKALYADNPELYIVVYRDKDEYVEAPLTAFLEASRRFSIIPASRIVEIRRGDKILYKRASTS